jgi:hypothetical protein
MVSISKTSDHWRTFKFVARAIGVVITFGAIFVGLFTGAPFFPHTPEGWFWFGMMVLAASEVRR